MSMIGIAPAVYRSVDGAISQCTGYSARYLFIQSHPVHIGYPFVIFPDARRARGVRRDAFWTKIGRVRARARAF